MPSISIAIGSLASLVLIVGLSSMFPANSRMNKVLRYHKIVTILATPALAKYGINKARIHAKLNLDKLERSRLSKI